MPHEIRDNPAGYYAAFPTSAELRRAGETLVWHVEQGNWRQHDALIEVISRFDEESARAYVLDGIAAMGITGSAERFVRSTLATLSATITRLSRQIVPKLDRKQMELAARHVRSLSLSLPREGGGDEVLAMAGFIVPDHVEEQRLKVSAGIRGGDWQGQRRAVSKLLGELGDLMLEEIYLKSIRLMGFGFLTEKLIQGGAGVARTLQHQLINWAVSSLGEPEFLQMVIYMEKLTLQLQEPLPHRFIYYPDA